ncbi:MAG: CocE/NonD family hydrolase [Pseudomonadota bacterium]|nr:CocE/NonD family hydrolase [Pseudomonadota bacterium]
MAHIQDNMVVEFDVPIEMDDGAVLCADVFRPIGDGRYPVLIAHGPYGKGLAFYDGHFKPIWEMMTAAHPETAQRSSNKYQVWEMPDPERWTGHGYVVIRVDSRGSGRSPGVIDLFSPRETQDYKTCIEWAGVQDWSNGKVGTSGISYYGINQWLVAATQPKHLEAMFIFEGAADMYRDISRHGGILTTFWDFLIRHQILSVQNGVGIRGYKSAVTGDLVSGPATMTPEMLTSNYRNTYAEQLNREMEDTYYTSRSPDWSKVKVPFLSAGSWGGQALHLRGNTEAFVNAASEEKYLEMHGLEHWTHYYTDYGFNLQKAFFDKYLKDEPEGFEGSPRVRLQVRHANNRFVERGESAWPLAGTQWTHMHLDAKGQTLSTDAPVDEASVTYAPMGDGVTFLTEPMAEDTEITGPMAARLVVSSQSDDADLFLVARVFGPDMKEQVFIGSQDPFCPVTLGWLRASHRKLDAAKSEPWRPYHAHDELQKLTPGEKVTLDIEIWPTSIVVQKGCRIGLSVRGRDYVAPAARPTPIYQQGRPDPNGVGAMFHTDGRDRPAETFAAPVTIHTGGDHENWVMLPIIPADR